MNALSYFAQYYYAEGLMVATGLTALVISITRFRRHRELRIFAIYLAFSMTQIGTDFIRYMRPGERLPGIVEVLTTLGFMVFENIVCIIYIYKSLISRRSKRIIAGFPLFFVAGFLLAMKIRGEAGVFVFFLVDCISLTIPCLLYFYEQFLYPSRRPLKTQPAFWVITGILFLNCVSIPLYLLSGLRLHDLHEASSLNFILYAALYCLIARAFLCRPVEEFRPKTDTATTDPRVSAQTAARRTVESINQF
jgi:hypothetical protein